MAQRNTHPVLVFALLAALIALLFFGIYKYRHRFVMRHADLVQMVPASGDPTTFFLDAALLRQTGYLDLLAAANTPHDPDYRRFVDETNFDYSKDIDAAAGSIVGDRVTLLAQGRFDWSRLAHYASSHGGGCEPEDCHVPARRPGRFVSFAELQPDVMVIVIGPEMQAAARIIHAHAKAAVLVPAAPVWVRPARSLVKSPAALPLALRTLAITLQSSSGLLLSLNSSTSGAAFDITLSASFENQSMADTARTQLAQGTALLKLELQREHDKPSAADLTGLLTAGTFYVKHSTLTAVWPVQRELLNALR